jgi:predicted metal-binding protein
MKDKALSHATPWRTIVIVCRKCGKKLDGGFGRKQKETLKTLLRGALRQTRNRRDVRICETSCLGLCPKGGVSAINASDPGTIRVIPAGMDAVEAVRALLGGDRAEIEGTGLATP